MPRISVDSSTTRAVLKFKTDCLELRNRSVNLCRVLKFRHLLLRLFRKFIVIFFIDLIPDHRCSNNNIHLTRRTLLTADTFFRVDRSAKVIEKQKKKNKESRETRCSVVNVETYLDKLVIIYYPI